MSKFFCDNCNEGIKHDIAECDPKCDKCYNIFGDMEFHDPDEEDLK